MTSDPELRSPLGSLGVDSDGAAVPEAMAQMFVARLVAMALGIGGMAVLARLLTPSDFGTFAFGLAVFTVAQAVTEFGLMADLVRRDHLHHADLRSAAGLALALALGVSAVAALGSVTALSIVDLAADVFGVLGLLVGALVAEAVALPYEARRRRSIHFRLLSVLEVGRSIAEIGVGLLLAWRGFGPVALAAGFFASRLTTAALLVVTRPGGSRVWPSRRGWRNFRGFGGRFVAARLLPRVGELGVVALITSGLGVGPLGLYNRSGAVHSIPDRTIFEAINPVVLPALAKVVRSGVALPRIYVDKVDYLAAVCWPAFASIIVLADPLVDTLLGSQWTGAIGPIRILAVAGFLMPFSKMSMKLFVAVDRIDLHLRVQIITVVATVVGVGLGSLFSLELVCAAIVAAQLVQCIGVWWGVSQASDVALRLPLGIVGRNVALALAAIVAPLVLVLGTGLSGPVVLVVGVLLGAAGWLIAIVAIGHPLARDVRGLRTR